MMNQIDLADQVAMLDQKVSDKDRRISQLESVIRSATHQLQGVHYHNDLNSLQHEVGMVINHLQRS